MNVAHPAPNGATVTSGYYEHIAMERQIAKHRRLLEAAPALVAALRNVVVQFGDNTDPFWKEARAILARLDGETCHDDP